LADCLIGVLKCYVLHFCAVWLKCFDRVFEEDHMPSGGARPGAGRKPGHQTVKTKERLQLAKKALEQGISPLEVMLNTMRELFDNGQKVEACKIAADAAPYCHSKLATIELTGDEEKPVALSFGWKTTSK
jgi:hypothetical protein